MNHPKYSIVIPVYNRPQEVEELLESLTQQSYHNFEVILVEDGSTTTSEKVFEKYSQRLSIHYFFKPNSGPGPSRNFGFENASGDYFVVFDSDCILPSTYFAAVENHMRHTPLDAWGGPDRAATDFTPVQQAMAHTMSSILTTGGIRGGHARGFQPRSFNMGISKEVFHSTHGFHFDRFAEDIELSIRIAKAGYRIGLISEAYVYHRRRADFTQFYRQVFNFGKGRALIGRAHPGQIKIAHWFPAFFLLGAAFIPVLTLASRGPGLLVLFAYCLYFASISIEAIIETRSLKVALLSIPSAAVQLSGYAIGFLSESLKSGKRAETQ